MTHPRLREWLPAHALAAYAVALAAWVVMAGVVAVSLWGDRSREIDKAKHAAAATTALMEAHTARTFQVVDLALQDVAERLEEAAVPRHDARLRELMRARLHGMPYVRALFVIGPDGYIQHDTDYPRTPDVSLADRDYFLLHQRDPALLRSISSPLKSRSGTGWFVAATRRIGDGSKFRGIVVAAIQLRYFADLYERMELGDAHRIALFHRDGRLIAQHPPDDALVGKSFADYPLFRTYLPAHSHDAVVTAEPPLPYPRIFSYAALADEPLVVGLAHDLRSVLRPWRRAATLAAVGLGLLLAVLLVGITAALRSQTLRQQLRERQLQGEKMEALGQLTGSITHDFANLMQIVGGNLDLVRRSAGSDGVLGLALARAQRALDTGADMTRRLLSFARARDLAVTEVDLHAVLQEVKPLLEQAGGSGVRVEYVLQAARPVCRADRVQLEVALINLVVNARDAMGARGRIVLRSADSTRPDGGIVWRRHRQRPWLDLCVEDNGPGMPESVRKRALEPFFTTKGEAGTGLGLAQVHGLMQQLDGEIEIDSAPGRGTAVHLLFPVADAR